MKVVVVRPNKSAVLEEIENTLEAMQSLVGGYIEAINPWNDGALLVCNEEGKLKGLPWNRPVVWPGGGTDIIMGTFFLCCATPDGDFCDLREDLVEKYMRKYA